MYSDKEKRPYREQGNKGGYKKRGGGFIEAVDGAEEPVRSDIIEGKNAVMEAVSAGREIDKIMFASGSQGSVGAVIAAARKAGVLVQETDRRKLDNLSATGAHQGIIALCAAVEYRTIDDAFALAEKRGEKPIFIICDEITDPHNLGAIIRSAEVSGAHGVIIPKRRSAGLNAACAKAAAGALEHLPVIKAQNVQSAINELKQRGVFVFAADMEGTEMYRTDFTGAVAVIIGSEGSGVSKLARESSDGIVSIPQKGRINSLNASNAAAVLLYEAYRQRIIN